MAIRIWRGDAQPRSQVYEVTVADVERGDKFTLSLNRKDITVTADEAGVLTDQDALVDNVLSAFATAIGSYSNTVPEWAEVSASVETDSETGLRTKLILTGPVDGKPMCDLSCSSTNSTGSLGVQVTTITEGDAGQNEQQQISILGTATGGTFTITFDGQTTAAIAYNATAGTVQTALEALSNIDAGDVTVTGSAGGPWTVEFKQQYANDDVPLMTTDGSSLLKGAGSYAVHVETVADGDPGKNEIQLVSVEGATGGSFNLTFQGSTTASMAYNVTAGGLQSALEALTPLAVGDVSVTKPAESRWLVEFTGNRANEDVDTLTGNGASLTGMVTFQRAEQQKGSAGTNEVQTFRIAWDPGVANNAFSVERSDTGQSTGWEDPDSLFAGIFQASDYTSYEKHLEQIFGSPLQLDYGEANVKATVTAASEGSATAKNYVTFTIEWINNEGGKSIGDHTVSARGTVSGTVTNTTQGSSSATNEIQRIILSPKPTGGTFRVRFRGQYTASLAYNISAADLKTALEGLSTIDTVTVTDQSTDSQARWDVEFTGAEGGQDLGDWLYVETTSLTGGQVTTKVWQEAVDPTNETQKVSLFGAPAGGTFTLTFDGNTTAAIAWNASNQDVESALQALANITDVRVSSDEAGGPWTIEFLDPGGQNVKQLVGDGSSLSGSQVAVSTIQEATSAKNEVQRVKLLGSPTGGTFTLTFGAATTTAISYDAEPAEVQAALEGLAGISVGDVSVTGGGGGPWTVEFIGTLAGADQTAMTGTSSLSSSGAQTITCTQTTAATGPNWWSEAENWQTPGSATATAPQAGDIVVFENSDVDCLYGLEDNNVALAELRVKSSFTGDIGLPTHTGLYWECRPTALKVTATKVFIGEGEGAGSARIRLDLQATQTTVEVFNTGASADELPAFVWQGTHASNACRVHKGSVGIGMESHGDDAKLATLDVDFAESRESDALVWIGSGVSQLTTVTQIGGQVVVDAQSSLTTTTYTKDGGTLEWRGEGKITNLKELQGRTDYMSTGTITTLTVGNDGEVHFTKDPRSRTVTNCTIEAGATLVDSNRTVTWTNPVVLSNCNLEEVTLDLGTHITLAVAGGP